MRRFLSPVLASALLAAWLLGLTGCRKQPERYTATWFDLFDTVTIVIGYAGSQAEWEEQTEALHEELLRCHRLFDIYNHYDGVTNLYDVNAGAAAAPVAVESDLYDFLQFAVQMERRTGGACNAAAGAVLALWHDAREMESPLPPDEAALAEAGRHCDISDLILDDGAHTVYFADPALRLDVGAIGKGYAVELAAQHAEQRGITSMLLNVGGNVRAIGAKPDGEPWLAGVENPWESGGPVVSTVELAPGECLVISGDYQRYFEYEGVRYHHLIDLTTLQPARYQSAVAVHCLGSGLGDAFSTALFCLPEEEGMALAQQEGLNALWMHPDGSTAASPGWTGQ